MNFTLLEREVPHAEKGRLFLCKAPCNVRWHRFSGQSFPDVAAASSIIAISTQDPTLFFDAGSAPNDLEQGWNLLGYDVSDRSLLSGLMNCGYEPGERYALKQAWAGRLNANHLFDKEDDAIAFALATNLRVPEHAPFLALGIWQLNLPL